MAQTTHGSAPGIAGPNTANSYAMIMSGQMLFEWFGRKHDSDAAKKEPAIIENAVSRVMTEKIDLPGDLGGIVKTTEMGDAVVDAIARNS